MTMLLYLLGVLFRFAKYAISCHQRPASVEFVLNVQTTIDWMICHVLPTHFRRNKGSYEVGKMDLFGTKTEHIVKFKNVSKLDIKSR